MYSNTVVGVTVLVQDFKENYPIFPQASMQLLENNELEVLFSISQWIVAEIIYSLPTVPIIFLCGLTGSLYVQGILFWYLHTEKSFYWHKLAQPNWL